MEEHYDVNDDLPSGERIWELAAEAIRIEKFAKESGGLSYELFVYIVNDEADWAMSTMDPVEQRFFATCFRGVYTAPEKRGEEWESEQEIRQELSRDVGEENEIDMDRYDTEEGWQTMQMMEQSFRNLCSLDWSDLLQNGSLAALELAQREIDEQVKLLCVSINRGRWTQAADGTGPRYTKSAVYPRRSDDYESYDSASQIMATNVLPRCRSELNKVYNTNCGEFQPKGATCYHLVARFSEEGTRWGVAGFYLDDFSEQFNWTTIVSTFDSLKDASQWVKSERQAIELRAAQNAIELPKQDEDLRHVMRPEDLADPEKRAEFWQAHSDPVQETLVSLSPEAEEVRRVFIMERDVLPRRKTESAEILQTSYGPFHARGEIEYDLVAKVSAAGTTWAIAAQHYDWDDFADRGPRLVEVVDSFDSLKEAKAWLASERALVAAEVTDPRRDLEAGSDEKKKLCYRM